MAVYNIKAEKDTRCTQSVLQIKGDRHTQILRFHVDRYDGGVDLSEYTWAIQTRNAAGVEDAFSPEAVEIFENVILVDWMLKGSVTTKDGLTEYELSALEYMDDETTPVWRGGIGTISVRNNLSPSFGNVEGLTEVEQLILYVDGKLHEVISAGEEASSAAVRANAAADRAEPAADSAEAAANMANDAASAATTAAANAKSAAGRADASAASANEAILNLTDYASEYALRVRGEIGESAGNPVMIAPDEGSLIRPVTVFSPKQSGSGDPSPGNVRPISGYDVLGLNHAGNNLFGGKAFADAIKSADKSNTVVINESGGTVVFSSEKTGNVPFYKKLKPNTRYTIIINGKNSNGLTGSNICVYYNDGIQPTYALVSFSDASAASYGRFVTPVGRSVGSVGVIMYGGVSTLYYDKCGIFEGVVALEDFEAYQGDTYFAHPGQMVYAGRMDWTTGTMLSDGVLIDGSLLNWNYWYDHMFFAAPGVYLYDALCEIYPKGSTSKNGIFTRKESRGAFYIRDTTLTDGAAGVDELKQKLTGHKIVYLKENANVIQLTPHQIFALKGNNTLYGDGDTIETLWVKPLETSIKERTEPLIERIAALEAVILNS